MTKEQIARLYAFTSKHFVAHYDLQTELVDHLANGIESMQQEHPEMDFEMALRLEFKKFGVFGFHDVVQKHRAAMNKRYRNIIWGFFKTYFKWPRFLMTVAFVLIYFTVLQSIGAQLRYYFILTTAWAVFVFLMIKTWLFRKKQISKSKKWLLEELIFNQIGLLNVLLVPIQLLNFASPQTMESLFFQWAFSIGAVLYLLLAYITTTLIPRNAEELLRKTYPEYRIR
ncbi:hypothetical protein [Spongiimicrobium salis]|uniref:hypothetical protein n=1 Tax=Spongiimicrobium salis TaxID=1667022 RepID=UPI00374D7731